MPISTNIQNRTMAIAPFDPPWSNETRHRKFKGRNENERNGQLSFGGKAFFWSENIYPRSEELNEIIITVGLSNKSILYELRAFIEIN